MLRKPGRKQSRVLETITQFNFGSTLPEVLPVLSNLERTGLSIEELERLRPSLEYVFAAKTERIASTRSKP